MPSQANTYGPVGGEFISDTTQQTVTLTVPGGTVINVGNSTTFINIDNGAVVTTEGNNPGNVPLPAGASKKLPITCSAFSHKTPTGSTFLVYEGHM